MNRKRAGGFLVLAVLLAFAICAYYLAQHQNVPESSQPMSEQRDPATRDWTTRTDAMTGITYALPKEYQDAVVREYAVNDDIDVASDDGPLTVQFSSSYGYWITIARGESGERTVRDESIVTPVRASQAFDAGYYFDQTEEARTAYAVVRRGGRVFRLQLPSGFVSEQDGRATTTPRTVQLLTTVTFSS